MTRRERIEQKRREVIKEFRAAGLIQNLTEEKRADANRIKESMCSSVLL